MSGGQEGCLRGGTGRLMSSGPAFSPGARAGIAPLLRRRPSVALRECASTARQRTFEGEPHRVFGLDARQSRFASRVARGSEVAGRHHPRGRLTGPGRSHDPVEWVPVRPALSAQGRPRAARSSADACARPGEATSSRLYGPLEVGAGSSSTGGLMSLVAPVAPVGPVAAVCAANCSAETLGW
jgi:hypothetical protein